LNELISVQSRIAPVYL